MMSDLSFVYYKSVRINGLVIGHMAKDSKRPKKVLIKNHVSQLGCSIFENPADIETSQRQQYMSSRLNAYIWFSIFRHL